MREVILSVVIPTYNSEAYLEPCLASVRGELQSGVEFLLVDGASSDRTMEIVETNRDLFSQVVSESDRGQSDAFNKGFNLASGRYLTWLNSDDILVPGVLKTVLEHLRTGKADWFAANSVYLNADGAVMRCCRSGAYEPYAVRNGILNVFGPSTIFSKALFKELGPIDEAFHYTMDTEYWWRIVASGRTYERLNVYLWGLRLHSDAKTASVILEGRHPSRMKEETQRIRETYYPEVSQTQKVRAAKLVQALRILNLSYVFAAFDTFRMRNKRLI